MANQQIGLRGTYYGSARRRVFQGALILKGFLSAVARVLEPYTAPWTLDYLDPKFRARLSMEDRIKIDIVLHRVTPF